MSSTAADKPVNVSFPPVPTLAGAMRITVWMNMPSPYQGDFFRELAGRREVELDVIYAEKLEPMRIGLGWSESGEGYCSAFLRGPQSIVEAVGRAWKQRDRIHVINGVWAIPAFCAAAVVLLLMGTPVFFHAETSDPRASRGGVRVAVRNLFGRLLLARCRGIFAISTLAERFYGGLGVPRERLFPFGYFKHHRFFARAETPRDYREILFVGQLVERKGVDLLLRAFVMLSAEFPTARLSYVGTGSLEMSLRRLAQELGVEARVRFEGAVGSSVIDDRIRLADVLVLPSLFDGWGLVVNEALAAGVPVVVSDACGAADMVVEPAHGRVHAAGVITDLRDKLQEVLTQPMAQRPDPTEWAKRVGLLPVVDYFVACLAFGTQRVSLSPCAPWRLRNQSIEVSSTHV